MEGVSALLDAIGLLLRRVSGCRLVGERERRSNLEARFGSGSVWSNRDRLDVRRSSSAMVMDKGLMEIRNELAD